MKTVQTHITAEFKAKSNLFRRLFLIQMELTEYTDERSNYHAEVKELIDRMDRLMDLMIEDQR